MISRGAGPDRARADAHGMSVELSRRIIDRCLALGFGAAGVTNAGPSRWAAHLLSWLEAGRHGSMDYLARDLEIRLDPRGILLGARSFIAVADVYSVRGSIVPNRLSETPPQGRIARYAHGRNYHAVMKKRLHSLADALRVEIPGSEFRTCVDTAPVLEREIAAAAGLGWQAKNTMVIHPRLGSYFLLGVVATTLELTSPPDQWSATDHCGACTRCIEACPTSAISPYSVDASRCISYLTIEHRTLIPQDLHAPMGDWLYGCDVCQEVCPHNSERDTCAATPHPAYAPRTMHLSIADVMDWSTSRRRESLTVSAMKRANLAMMRRNAVIVAGNSLRSRADDALLARLKQLANDQAEDPLVRDTAKQVLSSLHLT